MNQLTFKELLGEDRTENTLSRNRYSSNRPKNYPKVCKILDELAQQGRVEFVEDKDKMDRIYRLCDS